MTAGPGKQFIWVPLDPDRPVLGSHVHMATETSRRKCRVVGYRPGWVLLEVPV